MHKKLCEKYGQLYLAVMLITGCVAFVGWFYLSLVYIWPFMLPAIVLVYMVLSVTDLK